MRVPDSRRPGFALPSAIVALVLVGVLVTGGFVAATQERQISESTKSSGEAFNLAEFGLNKVIGTWRIADYERASGGGAYVQVVCRDGMVVDDIASCSNGKSIGSYSITVRQLGMSGELFEIRSSGTVSRHDPGNEPVRTLSMVVRTNTLDIPLDRAVSSGGPMALGGRAEINGEDRVPDTYPDKDRCESLGTMTGVVARNVDRITEKGASKIVGSPPKREDSSIDEGTFARFGGWTWEDLKEMATWTIREGEVILPNPKDDGGRCIEGDKSNWGAPKIADHPCAYYFPIIYAPGDLHLSGDGQGQGMLLVEGDLELNGGFEFYGLVIVQGTLEGGNGGARIYGSAFVRGGAQLEGDSNLQGSPVVNFSSCAVERAIKYNDATAYAQRISSRSWFDLSAIGVEN